MCRSPAATASCESSAGARPDSAAVIAALVEPTSATGAARLTPRSRSTASTTCLVLALGSRMTIGVRRNSFSGIVSRAAHGWEGETPITTSSSQRSSCLTSGERSPAAREAAMPKSARPSITRSCTTVELATTSSSARRRPRRAWYSDSGPGSRYSAIV
jgi:hypothetical protein